MSDKLPRYLSREQAQRLRAHIDHAIAMAIADLEAVGAEPRGLRHELGLELARAACRHGLDLTGSRREIERLEAVVADLNGRLELGRVMATATPTVRGLEASHAAAPNDPYARAMAARAAELEAEAARDLEASHAAALRESGNVPHAATCRCAACRG